MSVLNRALALLLFGVLRWVLLAFLDFFFFFFFDLIFLFYFMG